MTPFRAVAVAAMLFLGGCIATTNPQSPGIEGALYEDLPAAPGMALEKPGYGHKSPSGSVRDYTQHYSGSRRLEDTKRWYEETFAIHPHDWKLVSSEGTSPATLVFEKRAEKVTVTLQNVGSLLKVVVHVSGK